MSYFRIYEDNGMNIDAKETNVNIILNTNYVKPVLFSCTYCDAYFYSKEELFFSLKMGAIVTVPGGQLPHHLLVK